MKQGRIRKDASNEEKKARKQGSKEASKEASKPISKQTSKQATVMFYVCHIRIIEIFIVHLFPRRPR